VKQRRLQAPPTQSPSTQSAGALQLAPSAPGEGAACRHTPSRQRSVAQSALPHAQSASAAQATAQNERRSSSLAATQVPTAQLASS
jgi:hypothetical protein